MCPKSGITPNIDGLKILLNLLERDIGFLLFWVHNEGYVPTYDEK